MILLNQMIFTVRTYIFSDMTVHTIYNYGQLFKIMLYDRSIFSSKLCHVVIIYIL